MTEPTPDVENNIDMDAIRMGRAASMKRTMLFIVIVDFIGNLFFSYFANLINIIPILLDIMGFYGAKKYRHGYLIGYLIYILLILISRIYYVINPTSTMVFIIAMLFVVYYTWSLEFTWKFMTTVARIPEEKRALMRQPGWDTETHFVLS